MPGICPVKVTHSTVGAGDAMVAALAYSWDKKLGDEETREDSGMATFRRSREQPSEQSRRQEQL